VAVAPGTIRKAYTGTWLGFDGCRLPAGRPFFTVGRVKGSRLISLLVAAALLAAVAVPPGTGASEPASAQVAKKKCKAKKKGKSGAAAKKRKCKKKGGGSGAGAKFSMSPTSHNFGNVPFPATSPPSQAFVVQNIGGSTSGKPTVTLQDNSAIGVVPASSLSITANTCIAPLPKAGTCSITVQFNPPMVAVFASGLLIVSASPGNSVSASITGTS
jgi:hypothetical protein